MPYIAGIRMPMHHDQGIETIVATTVLLTFANMSYNQVKYYERANAEGGSVISMPQTYIGKVVTPIHALAITLPPLVYSVSTFANELVQPEWYASASFPIEVDLAVGIAGKAILRTLACAGFVFMARYASAAVKALGPSFHAVGVREKGKVASTGPYAHVRHPLYTAFLASTTLLSVATWNWIPLISTGITMACFAIKMPIEEKLIVDDAALGDAYKKYEEQVVYRIIPYIW